MTAPAALTQPRTRIHPQQRPSPDRIPLRPDRDRLPHNMQVAPALGQPALVLERRAATVPVHQVHRLARAVGGVGRCEAAASPLPGAVRPALPRDRTRTGPVVIEVSDLVKRFGPVTAVESLGKTSGTSGISIPDSLPWSA